MVKTIVLMLDAFRKDYITKVNTPFLYELTRKFGIGKLKQPFGFKNAEGFFTGIHPAKKNQFVYYGYNGKKPFFWSFLLRIFPDKLAFYGINFLRAISGKKTFLPTIKLKYLRPFTPALPNSKTLFKILEKEKISYLSYDFPLIIENGKFKLHLSTDNVDDNRFKKFLELLNKNKTFYYFHLWNLDIFGHEFGPESSKLNPILKKQDEMVKKIISNFELDKDNILIWSDHGMVSIKNICNLQSRLPKFGKGYLYFLDSTMARFWFFNEKKRKEVLSILQQFSDYGKLLSPADKKKMKIDFKHNFYGEEIFLMNSGILLFPNFFNKKIVKGMHGYDLSDKNEETIFFINKKSKKQAHTEDLFPTLLKLMNLKIPKNIDGKTLI